MAYRNNRTSRTSRTSRNNRNNKRNDRMGERSDSSDYRRRDDDKFPYRGPRFRNINKYPMPPDVKIDYKNFTFLQKYLTERGKIVSRRTSGISAKEQRQLVSAIKQARFLALLPSGAVKKL